MDLPINGMVIRIAEEADAEKLLEIYAPYVEKTAITFEYTVPSLEEFRERIRETLKKAAGVADEFFHDRRKRRRQNHHHRQNGAEI